MSDHYLLPGLQTFKQPLSLADIDPNLEFLNNFPCHQQPSSLALNMHNMHNSLMCDNVFPHLPESSGYSENFPGLFIHDDNALSGQMKYSSDNDHVDRKRKATEIHTPANTPANSSPQGSDNGIRRKNGGGRGKKVKGNEKKEGKPEEVVHVRAKRGQATDSHSLAERVRREKINERLRCLQDIVPGCYKTMGMAVMLDEIINYVQSLQNQVEFLSMKLTAASTFYDFNSETDALETMQRAKAFEALKMQNGISPVLPSAQFAPTGLNFESCPQFPHNR